MNWQTVVGLILLVCALLWGAYYLGGEMKERDIALLPKDTTTTIVVAPHVLPPATLTPNPAPVTIRVPVESKIADSLILVCANQDSLIRALVSITGTQQSFVSKDPTGLTVSGDLTVMYSPLEQHFLTHVTLDTIHVPERVITVTQTVIDERLDIGWVAASITGGMLLGALLMSGQ